MALGEPKSKQLKHDQLHISFPSLADQIRQLLADYEATILPRILAEDRSAALKAYQSGRFRKAELDGPANAARLARLTDNGIREVFRSKLDRKSRTDVSCRLDFQRTLRLPDDGKTYFLPPGRGCFPLRHVDDHAEGVPSSWMERGGVMMPMYQSEALWLNFHGDYPVALKVGAGKINAVSGEGWTNGLHREPQDYVVIPEQPWLDGFSVGKGVIRQFVATPLEDGCTVEEQVTGKGEFGGIQIQAYPMKARLYFDRFVKKSLPKSLSDLLPDLLMEDTGAMLVCEQVCYSAAPCMTDCDLEMGLGMGGRMQQEIYEDPYGLAAWDLAETSRCFVHLCNALQWREITGANPPQTPVTAKEYEKGGTPLVRLLPRRSRRSRGFQNPVRTEEHPQNPFRNEGQCGTPRKGRHRSHRPLLRSHEATRPGQGMERVRASGGGLAAQGQRLNLGYRRMVAPVFVLNACVLYKKKDMMIATKGTSSAMNDKKSKNSRIITRTM